MLNRHLIVASAMLGLFTAGSGVAYVAASGLASVGALIAHR
jgi:hypothetical protein